ncbi:hypothetical protein ACO1LD_13960, partial [Staphylococcus aureus]
QDVEIVAETPSNSVVPTLKSVFDLISISEEEDYLDFIEKSLTDGVFTSHIKYNQASKSSQIRINSEEAIIANHRIQDLEVVAQLDDRQ